MSVSAAKRRPVAPEKVIRDPGFSKRLNQVADQHGLCPPLHRGRLGWIREQMEKLGETVSNETVRKWLEGETKPRQDKCEKLAQVFQVDSAWLYMGQEATLTPKDRKARNAMASGAVNVVAGLIQMDGGHPAFPEGDSGAVDLFAIIRGAKYDLHISLGETRGRLARFSIPVDHDGVTVLGVIRDGFTMDVFELTPEVIDQHGHRKGGAVEIEVDGKALNRIQSFAQRF